MFNVRLVSMDYYLSKPLDELYFYESKNIMKEKQEPVLRIFGPTPDGSKSCVHVHGVYPYMYIPYKGGENPERDALLVGAALDEALKISLNAKLFRFIYDVILVSGIPLYGYHSKHRQFFKIYFYNPSHMRKASELLLSGAILGQKFQPHEAHIPYALQFMIDYNIYGMSFVTFSKVKYRRNPQNPDCLIDVRKEDILSDKVKKITCSLLEVDALASDIMNRINQEGIAINPGLRAIWENEKERRREQKINSQISVQSSQSRSALKICATEALYKARLSEKLKHIPFQESRILATNGEPFHSYPAEIPENRDIFEASTVLPSTHSLRAKEPIHDLNSLIDQKILSQIAESQKQNAENESEEDETEVDSIIGRNQKAEEAELEDEEGVDMTQPLNIDEKIIYHVAGNGDEAGNSIGNSEESFWKSMANKIFQLDGAQESSSESEVETNPLATTSDDRASGASLELSSAWSSNIMSILSEDSGCPTPATLCQTPRTFWSNYSPNWLPQNQDPWTWNKNSTTFSEPVGKSQSEGLSFGDFSSVPKDYISGETFDFFVSNDGEHFPPSSIIPLCSVESTASLPSDILAPGSEVGRSDFNLESIGESFHSPAKSEKCSLECKFTETKRTFNRKLEDERQRCLQVLKNFAGKKAPLEGDCNQLTLKQYIKDCEEIVSIDFKNLCNKEMIIIEYKSQNKRSHKNKYLIKPLDKFLESWNSAERKAGDRKLPKNGHRSKILNEFNIEEKKKLHSAVINVLEKTFSDSSRVQSVSNKLTVKAMEILPNGSAGKDRSYNVNQNVISQGKIKMKLIKSQRENLDENMIEGKLKRQRSENCFKLDLNGLNARKRKGTENAKKKQKLQPKNVHKSRIVGKHKKWKKSSEPDSTLINEINSSFEEYFKSIVQRKNFSKKANNLINDVNVAEKKTLEEEEGREEEEEEEEEEEMTVNEKADVLTAGKRHDQHLQSFSNGDPVKFLTRFLTAFSRMSDIPPLSITISFGNPQISVPVQVNLQTFAPSPEKKMKCFGKKQRKKETLENVDGPADDSSSEESASGELTNLRSSGQKRTKREGCYRPLNVVVYSSPSKSKKLGKKRKISTSGTLENEKAKRKKGRKTFLTEPVEEKPGSCLSREGKEKENPSQNLVVRTNKSSINLKEFYFEAKLWGSEKRPFNSSQVQDFIDDSETKRTFMLSDSNCSNFKLSKTESKSKQLPKNVSQGHTEICLTFDDGLKCVQKPILKTENRYFLLNSKEIKKDMSVELKEDNEKSEEKMDEVSSETSCNDTFPHMGRNQANFREMKKIHKTEFSDTGISLCSDKIKNFAQVDEIALNWVLGSKTIIPKKNPLTRETAFESIFHQDTFQSEEKAPFYSDPRDDIKAVQSGPRFLKVKNYSVAKLKYFKSSLDILGIDEINRSTREREATNQPIRSHCPRITPLIKPPSSETASKWLLFHINSEKSAKNLNDAKVKLMHPLNQRQKVESDEEMNISLTISSLSEEFDTRYFATKEKVLENSLLKKRIDSNKEEMALTRCLTETRSLEVDQIPEKKAKIPNKEQLPRSSSKDGIWFEERKRSSSNSFQIREANLNKSFNPRDSIKNMQNAKPTGVHQHVSILVMELHVQSRKDFRPDPENDPINALFYVITFDNNMRNPENGILVVGERLFYGAPFSGCSVCHLPTEKALIEKFLDLVKLWDPEILAGYEIEMNSWGYLIQRGFILKMNLPFLLGRVQGDDFTKKNPWDFLNSGEDSDGLPRIIKNINVSGRIVLDVWRVLRHEITLTNYSFENVIYHLSHERHPLLSYESLSQYWEDPTCRYRQIVVEHYMTRVLGVIKILDQLDFVNRTSELSRLFGIQFYEVLSRGSQYRVESMMLRLAKPLNYILTSPSTTQRAAMRAPSSLPLILEPESLFYSDPIVVLDFQSLYPSIIIAYNYCFSTCLGRIENLGEREPFEFGCTRLQVSPEELRYLENELTISPAGIAFVKANIRKGILPTMLEEILETRIMLKKSLKENDENKILQKILFARQLGLKLIANVTYGYTAANFSGRMPCIEVGDSVVSKGRETLYRAIQLVKNTRKWSAKVVYGDTDSMFVLTPGRSRQEAFKIGKEIADAVTKDNPTPVKLKVEKVYQPCILQTKKRYVGYMFESPDQEKAVFEAKGIETVRRDGCPAAGKILQMALQILFDTRDVSLVKKYTIRQFDKLFQGRINMKDLIFAKEYRGRHGYRPGACVPALFLAKKWTQCDKRAEPRVKERVPYVITNGPPGVPLIQLVRSPKDLMTDPSLRINAVYYITKAIIPPIQRCLSLLGVDVTTWFAEMPRKYLKMYKSTWTECQKRNTISQYFVAAECIVCGEITHSLVCSECEKRPQNLVLRLIEKIRRSERRHESILEICRSCCRRPSPLECLSFECPVLFRRNQAERALEQRPALLEILGRYF